MINIGIFAHVDAGKTTLSEAMLLNTGAIRTAGSVDNGTAHTDQLAIERKRGISVRSSSVCMHWLDQQICLTDTPGHADFSAEAERTFWAIDVAVIVIDAVKGVQPQTQILFSEAKKQNLPVIFFINKADIPHASVEKTLLHIRSRLSEDAVNIADQVHFGEFICEKDDALMEQFINGSSIAEETLIKTAKMLFHSGKLFPCYFGSALKNTGVRELLNGLVQFCSAHETADRNSALLSAVVFASLQDKALGRGLWVRIYSGTLSSRDVLQITDGIDTLTGLEKTIQKKVTALRTANMQPVNTLCAGEIGIIYGLGNVQIGHIFGDISAMPRKVLPGSLRKPLLRVSIIPEKDNDPFLILKACRTLSSEDHLLQVDYNSATKQVFLSVMGAIQLEILKEELLERFSLSVSFSPPCVIYKETLASPVFGFAAYTMPKPCWAILGFQMRPGKPGSGVTFNSVVSGQDIMPRYQHQVEQAIPLALSQGRSGWQVTDIEITLTEGNHHLIHTHPLDFIIATPMAIHDGLKRAGTVLLQPLLECEFILPVRLCGRLINDINYMQGKLLDSTEHDDESSIRALLPVRTSHDYSITFAAYTSGKGVMTSVFHGYSRCPDTVHETTPRRGTDPLDTAKYILAARSALDGGIFDF